jgi:hypothetical protein
MNMKNVVRVILCLMVMNFWACEDADILVHEAMDQVSEKLVQDLSPKMTKDMRIGVPPFQGEGNGQDMAEKVKIHLQTQGFDAVILPDSPMWEQIFNVVDDLGLNEDALSGRVPDLSFEVPQHIILGHILWIRTEQGLARISAECSLVKMHPKPIDLLGSVRNHGAYVEFRTIILRGAFFLFLCVAFGRGCRLSYLSARRGGLFLTALAVLLIVVAFYFLLWDYVFFLYKPA